MTDLNPPTTTVVSNAEPLTPEAIIAQLRILMSQIESLAPLSQEQRKLLKQRARLHSQPVLDASINVIGVHANVSQALGQPLGDVRRVTTVPVERRALSPPVRETSAG